MSQAEFYLRLDFVSDTAVVFCMQLFNETATWLHVYQMGPPSWGASDMMGGITGGIQHDGGITVGVPIT